MQVEKARLQRLLQLLQLQLELREFPQDLFDSIKESFTPQSVSNRLRIHFEKKTEDLKKSNTFEKLLKKTKRKQKDSDSLDLRSFVRQVMAPGVHVGGRELGTIEAV